MFTGSPIFVRVQGARQRVMQGSSWFVILPGLMLALMGLAILVWPELLAYMVATVLLFAGISIALWGWTLRQAERRRADTRTIYTNF